MSDSKRIRISGKTISVDGNNIDTDRIIPADFLRCVTFDDLGEHAFADDRKQLRAKGETHPFDVPERGEAQVLLANKNFGCGSSREHAPQSLMRWNKGIRAIVGESYSEIFFGNCVALGIPCLTVSEADIAKLKAASDADASMEMTVDLEAMRVSAGELSVPAAMPDGARGQLLSGRWDSTADLLQGANAVNKTADQLPYFSHWS